MSLRIIELKAENFKRLRAVEIHPDGDSLVVIKGKNGAGKSSVLDALFAALCGKKAVPPKPIREGETRSEITVDLGDYVVTRVFTERDTYLTVKNGDGAKIANPQALLDTLIGSISFDPLEFARMKSVNQAANLAQITGIDFEELNQRKKEIFDERTDVNREAKRLTASITEIEKDVPDIRQKKPIEEESLESIVAEYDVAKALHLSTDEEVIRLDRFQTSLHRREEELESLKKKVAELENEIHEGWKDVERQATDLKERAKNLPDLEAIKQRMTDASNATVMNSHIKSYAEERSALKDMQQKAAQLSDSIEAIDKKKRDLVSNADLPVNNLTFDETGVFYQGVPFEQCCASEQLKISTAIAISLNPKLRVIRINDGSLLDTENLSVLESIAKKQDFQIWVERVGEDSNGVGILIEDGQVVETVTERSEEENVLP